MRGLAGLLCAALAGQLAVADERSVDGQLGSGIALVKAGDFESAIPPLSAAIQALNPDLKRRGELARAYLYLGVAYLELGQELEARGKFREALRNDPKIQTSPQEFSSQVRRVFEAERAAALPPKNKRNILPFVLVLGGGAAASAGIAVAAGGDSPPDTTAAAPTTTTTMAPGPGPTTTTTTTTMEPGPGSTTTTTTTTTLPTTTTTTPGTTTTTTPGSTTTTTSTTTTSTTTTTTPTTTTTTTTMPAPCQFTLTPNRQFPSLGGNDVCVVRVNRPTCNWTAEVFPASANWLTLNGPTSGTGDGSVAYSVALNLLGVRTALIRLVQDAAVFCEIRQEGLVSQPTEESVAWTSRLELPGGRGQVFLNGAESAPPDGVPVRRSRAAKGALNRIEAQLVRGGQPGTWTFEILAGHEPGSLRVLAGRGRVEGPDRIVFQLAGQPGERAVFVFSSAH